MILKSKETTVAYRCPVCGKSILSIVGIFTLTGDLIKLKCDCGHSEMTLTYTSDKRVRLTVPCVLCPNSHNYTISDSAFFERDIFTLSCPYSGLEVCFLGTPEKVKEAIRKSDEALIAMLREAGFDDYDMFRGGLDSLSDGDADEDDLALDVSQIEDILRFMLCELKEDGDIHCGCPDGEGEYDFEITSKGVRVFCKKCEQYREVPLNGTVAANNFLHIDKLILDDKDVEIDF